MKRFIHQLLLTTGLFVAITSASAQNVVDKQSTSILESLDSYRPGQGEVIINQSDALRKMIGARRVGDIEQIDGLSYLKIPGYRTQVFSGNNQRTSKDEAFRREKEIKELFPNLPTYVTYSAPFWKVRVGDFRSHEEAYNMKLGLSKAFPSFGKEMYIVREDIQLPLY